MSFHLYKINELFSNADGTVQFIEMRVGNAFDDESFWSGRQLVASAGGVNHTFTFLSNLPSRPASNTTVLIATQGFANLGLVTPDFIVPAGFLFSGSGSVSFAGVDSVSYSALPSSSTQSLNRNFANLGAALSTSTGTPTNFFGSSATLVAPNRLPTGSVAITGTLLQGQVLSADTSTLADADGLPTTLQYQWLRGGNSIAQATASSYTLVQTDVGQSISLRVSYTDLGGHAESLTSTISATVGGQFFDSPGADTITGSVLGDQIFLGLGNDLVNAGAGNDEVYARGIAFAPGANEGNDTLNGEAGNDTLSAYPGIGNHLLDGGSGEDTLQAGSGADTLLGGSGNDVLTAQNLTGNHRLDGGADNDQLFAGDGSDTLLGGTGTDALYGGAGASSLNGGDGDDTLYGGAGASSLDGGGGNDLLSTVGHNGNNLLQGGAGQDELDAGSGNDSLFGGDDNDVLSSQQQSGNHLLDGGAGSDTLYGGDGNDTLLGGTGNDSIYGGNVSSTLSGGDGNDALSVVGRNGDYRLDGGIGNDTLQGGAGNDTLIGGTGVDRLWGGPGNDTYVITSRSFDLYDGDGADTANVSASFVKLPGNIETVNYTNGALALPYWIDALLDGNAASFSTLVGPAKTLSYTFPTTLPAYDTDPADAQQFQPFNAAQKAFAQQALAYVSTVTGLGFVQTGTAAAANTITFANNAQTGSAGYATFPSDSFTGSDLFLNVNIADNLAPQDGQASALTLIHELGHALGLKHPFGHPDATGHLGESPYLPDAEDNTAASVMSYTSSAAQYHLLYSPLDIAALQYLYGPSPTARSGPDNYVLNAASANFIWDGAGNDSIDASALSQPVTLYLEPGYWGFIGGQQAATITASGQVTVNFGSSIENLLGGSGADHLFGNSIDNQLRGGAGNDTLDGALGTDTALFSGARALYTVTADGSGWIVNGPDGSDSLSNIEFAQFTDQTIALAPVQPAGKQVDLMAYSWKAHTLLDNVSVTGTGVSGLTGGAGSASLANVAGSTLSLSAARTIPDAEAMASSAAVNLQDAIAIMKMIVGLDINGAGRPLSPYQALAADFDGNGSVSLNDAIGVLRHVVGLDAPALAWHFADELDASVPNKTSLSPGTAPAIAADISAASPVHVGLVGYLSGDVDGSYAGAAGAQDLDITQASYFQTLVNAHANLSLAQFGVYS